MSKCPYYQYEDTGWFSWREYCKLTGAKIGSEYDKTQVDNLCNNKDSRCYEDCPIYKRR